MNTTEINGFEIDKFNQHSLDTKSKQGTCPKCSNDRSKAKQKAKCASYDWDRGIGSCHNCGERFQLHTFKRKSDKPIEYNVPPAKTISELDPKAVEWFKTRGISEQTVKDMKISTNVDWMPQTQKNENVIEFNYYMFDTLLNCKTRDARKNFKLISKAQKIFYNIDSIYGQDECYIVEGEMDVLAMHEAGIKNVVSVPNGATLGSNNLDYLDDCIDFFEDKLKIVIATDNDEAGKALKTELIRRLGAEICYTVDFGDCKDANDCLIEHGAEETVRRAMLSKAVPLEGVTTFRELEGEITDFVKNGFTPGFQIGLDNFDDIFSTYTGQFITVTGIPSSGKSDFVDQMCIGYNQKYDWKIAYASPENKPNFLHAHKLMRKVWQGLPTADDLGGDKWQQISDHVNDNFFFIDAERYTLEKVLKKGAELVKRKGIKCLVIDPFNKVRDIDSGHEDVNRYTMEYLTKIDSFCKKYDVLVIIVAHPTKMYKDKDGNIEEPTMYNIKGGGEWYDASYHGLLVHRNYEENTVKAKVLKVKFQNLGTNGAESHFKWEPDSGCYVPHVPIETDSMPWETS
jgi:twinkle protein